MNWLQERLMMSSTMAAPGAGAGGVAGGGPVPGPSPGPLHSMFPASSSPSSTSSPAGPMSYEGRMAMIPPPAYPNPYQNQFTANLNFNLINNSYKQKEAEAASESFEDNRSPSSGTGSPRTDETLDKTSDPVEADTSHEADTMTGLEMLRQQANSLPEPEAPGPGLSIRRDIQTEVSKSSNKIEKSSEDEEIHDVEENEEELLIDEEMEENDVSREKHEETFEEVPVEKIDKLKQFSNFQPYLNVREGGESGAINSLEKLQQVSESFFINFLECNVNQSYVKIQMIATDRRRVHSTFRFFGKINNFDDFFCTQFYVEWKKSHGPTNIRP